MNQLEDDLHRVLQLARAHSRLSRQSKSAAVRSHQLPSRPCVTTQRHRHTVANARRARPPATLLEAKLKSISAIYGLERGIPTLSDCSTRTTRAQSAILHASAASTPQSGADRKPHESESDSALHATLAARRNIYRRHFSGLRAPHGPSGLPKLECLLDAAQHAKRRMARHSALAVGAAVLTSGDRIYASCAVESLRDATFAVCAERAALLKALGEDPSEVVVAMAICSDAEEILPSPCGSCREFMAEAGDFAVYLVNARLESEETRSFALFPRARQASTAKVLQHQRGGELGGQRERVLLHQEHADSRASGDPTRPSISGDDDTQCAVKAVPLHVRDWTSEHVLRWLEQDVELPQYRDVFQRSAVDGCTLLHLQDCDLQLLLGVLQPLHRRRILLHIDRAKDRELLEHGIDYGQLQDYLAVLDRDRITVVAELKATFDRLDQNHDGWLDFREVRQALRALRCDATPPVVDALLRGKLLGGDADGKVAFPDFVAAFSSLAMQPAREEGGGGSCVHAAADPVWQLPVLDLRGLRRTFDKADRNRSDGVDEQELAELFHGLDASKPMDACARKAREWFAAADSDGDGRLSFAEFLVRYIELKQVDVSKLTAFFASCEPVASARLKPVTVLRRALESFFADVSPAEISVWYKRHLNSELLRTVKDDVVSPVTLIATPGGSDATQQDGPLEPVVVVTPSASARASLSISFADFVLAVFLFQNHVNDRRQHARALQGTLSNDALVHRSRIVHLQQSGHVRMCPQSKDAADAATAANLSLAEIRRNQLKLRLRSLQSQHERASGDEGKAASDDGDDDSVEAGERRQKRHLAALLARVDAAFDRFNHDEEKKRDTSDSEASDTAATALDDGALNAMETAQAMTELGIACPREQMLRLLKDEGIGIHDRASRRDFRRLFLHFHAQSEAMVGKLPAHRRPMTSGRRVWDDDADHTKRMREMTALLSGEHGKHRSRQDYDHYLLQRRQQTGSKDDAQRSGRGPSCDLKRWTAELTRLQTKKDDAKGGDSSDSSTSSDDDNSSDGKPQSLHQESRLSEPLGSAETILLKRLELSEREELVRAQRRLEDAERRREGFEVGDRVVAADDGRGTLIRLHRDYFVADVHFDSGKRAKNVDLSKLKRVNPIDEQAALRRERQRGSGFHVGMRVAVSHRGTKTTRKGKISVCRLDGTFDVFVDQLGERETLQRVPAKLLRALASKPTVYAVGANVTVKQKHAYLRGTVQLCRVDGTYDVCLRQDQSVLKRVEADLLFPDDSDGDDSGNEGEPNRRAPSKKSITSKKRAASDSDDEKKRDNDGNDGYDEFELEFSQGDRVEVRFQGNAAFYPGRISRAQTDGTYDVVYDDGDGETRVKSHFIRLLTSASSGTSQPKTSSGSRNAKGDDYEDDFE
ncbi:hypothetical protein PybrP1_011587 [[Pythium] brassicae (nom. inval.)]|nr:hypothetical protein PybrP1_011587 [[Pythium] brassicae (nom. inval.)]